MTCAADSESRDIRRGGVEKKRERNKKKPVCDERSHSRAFEERRRDATQLAGNPAHPQLLLISPRILFLFSEFFLHFLKKKRKRKKRKREKREKKAKERATANFCLVFGFFFFLAGLCVRDLHSG